jgi:TonB-dependent SusC/RagA subfamily outer membrane receptor
MHSNRITLAALISLKALLFCGQARAQAADSIIKREVRIVTVKADSSAKHPSKSIRIVCAPSIAANKSPLFVIDGTPASEQNLRLINPDDVDKVKVLKSGFAEALYGSRAANGAVLITLKKRASKHVPQPKIKEGHLN